jgi:hypothetical protein
MEAITAPRTDLYPREFLGIVSIYMQVELVDAVANIHSMRGDNHTPYTCRIDTIEPEKYCRTINALESTRGCIDLIGMGLPRLK